MLKFLRLGALLIAVALTTVSTAFFTTPASATDTATLNAQMKQAVCVRNWGDAVNIADQMIAITPSNNQIAIGKLKEHRARMQKFYDSNANVPANWSEYCSATPANFTVAASNNSEVPPTDADESFITDFKYHAANYPQVSDLLIAGIDANTKLYVNQAKSICKALKGGYFEELNDSLVESYIETTAPTVKDTIITHNTIIKVLAPQYYCPEFSGTVNSEQLSVNSYQ